MKYIVLLFVSLFIGFIVGRQTTKQEVITKFVQGEIIRDTIMNFVPDTVYIAGELKYKYEYKTDTIYKDVPVIDREESIVETIRDWNRTREYSKLLFDNESGKLSVALSMQYNELQKLSYSFTPMYKETTIVKKRVFVPFVSASFYSNNSFSAGWGFFYHSLGFRVEYSSGGLNWGVMYKF